MSMYIYEYTFKYGEQNIMTITPDWKALWDQHLHSLYSAQQWVIIYLTIWNTDSPWFSKIYFIIHKLNNTV